MPALVSRLIILTAAIFFALASAECDEEITGVERVSHTADLRVSEPDPQYFGNSPNLRNSPHWSNSNWLRSIFHFSFAEVNYPDRSGFGVLRVMNDDLVQPKRGFGTHPHSNMEICTYIVNGELTHKDSMGTSETLGRGAVQFMTAGTGVQHSEHNLNPTVPLRFIQMWITPRKHGLKPNYGSKTFAEASRQNRWLHLVGDVREVDGLSGDSEAIRINQDANMYVREIPEGGSASFELGRGRWAYILIVEAGDAAVDFSTECATKAVDVVQHDAIEVRNGKGLHMSFQATRDTLHVLVVEMSSPMGPR